jgi:hypothetical protein
MEVKKSLMILGLAVASSAALAATSPVGYWTFDDPLNLGKATIGLDLTGVGTHSAVSGISGTDGAVLDGVGSYFTCTHGIAPNGGGAYVNQWTVVMDINIPSTSLGQWLTFLQTNTGNSNDGDCFVNPTENLGVGATGYSTSAFGGDTWYRVAVSVDNGNFYRYYVDGNLWKEGTVQTVDGRFSLDPDLLIFADNDGDDYDIKCSNLAIWGQGLSSDDVAALGGAGVTIVPEPGTLSLALLGGMLVLLRRFRR